MESTLENLLENSLEKCFKNISSISNSKYENSYSTLLNYLNYIIYEGLKFSTITFTFFISLELKSLYGCLS